jgi:hypothetical protein
MQRALTLRIGWAFALFAFLDIICVGMGMGVPIFCILFGLPVGWYMTRRISYGSPDLKQMLGPILLGAALTSGVTFVAMALLWGPSIAMLFDPAADLVDFGIPQILYEPVASFVGWMVLMILVSPFLQFLMTLFGSHMTLWWLSSRAKKAEA